MIRHIGWSSEFHKNSGEGQLARKYINTYFKGKKIKIISPKISFFLSDYIFQIYGIFVLWYYYFLGKKIIYINYLPLWNFLIFLLSPPNTVFGPITGSIQINKIQNIKSIFRFFIIPLFYKISLLILNFRARKIIFGTNILIKFLNKNILRKSKLNFILENIKFKNSSKKKREYDLIVYYRNHENKFFSHHTRFINSQIKNRKKVIIVGDKLNIEGALQLGKVSRKKIKNLISISKFALSGDDNLLSFFNLECLQNNVKVIFNYKLKFQITKINKRLFIPYNFGTNRFIK